MGRKKLHLFVQRRIEEQQEKIISISDYIFNHPELGDEEFLSSAYLRKVLEKEGFTVTKPYKGLETAFRAEYKVGDGPKIAFLAEYDALPGYGKDGKPAHACGHNWIAATAVGTGMLLATMQEYFQGTVIIFGTPAEETFGRKVDLVNQGAFNDVDAVFQMHLYSNSNLKARALAMNAVSFEFTGRSTHAAANPEEGINALDAVMLTFTGINYLRQQLQSDVRIHGIVTKGGEAPNTIPSHCKCLFYVRAATKGYFEQVFEKVKNCARGAAMMTGTELTISCPENAYDDLVVNPVLANLMEKHMELSGFEPLSQEDETPGSTDIGNVSQVCPTLYGNVGIGEGTVQVHEEKFLEYANGAEAKKRALMAIESFVCAASELSEKPDLLNEVHRAFRQAVK